MHRYLVCALLALFVILPTNKAAEHSEVTYAIPVEAKIEEPVKIQVISLDTVEIEPEPIIVDEPEYSDEVKLLALLTMAEAEGEPENGKRLVIDTVLNRVDSKHFPSTIHDVIYQKDQFTSMWNGRAERCSSPDDICELVLEEMASRTNYDVAFFNAGHYSAYGTPMFQVQNHYFSSYD